eukprot:Hpha_TRINITY_DN22584_c0_g1::TRINITY_DN22584_c0_g1_i1::g.185109::m.185109/K12389/BTS, CLN3; battenin
MAEGEEAVRVPSKARGLLEDEEPEVTEVLSSSTKRRDRVHSGSRSGAGSQLINIERQSTGRSDLGVEIKSQTCSRNWLCFWWLGIINNLPYVLIMAGAKKIADDDDEKHLMPLLNWGLVAIGFVVRIFNTIVLAGKPYTPRFMAQAVGTVAGLVIVGTAPHMGSSGGAHFGVAVLGTVILGGASSFGESTALGYMYKFPQGMVGGWSSGTGMAGVLGSTLTLALFSAGMSVSALMFVSTAWVAIYIAAYCLIKDPDDDEYALASTPPGEAEEVIAVDETGEMPEETKQRVSQVDWERIRKVHRKCFHLIIQMALVYVFEYAVQSAAAYVQPCETDGVKTDDSPKFFVKNFYVISQIMYQSGVFLSRSSLPFFRIHRVGLLSLAQLVMMVVWLTLAKTKWMGDAPKLYWLFPLMFVVGLFGGASYVNVFHLVQTDPSLTGLDKELAMNIGGLYVNLGIIGGSVVTLVFANTVLAGEECDDGSSGSGSLAPFLAPMLAPMLGPVAVSPHA